MFTKTFERDGVKATLRGSTGRDLYLKRTLMRRMDIDPTDETMWNASWEFVSIVSQSTDVVTPFTWPTSSSTGGELLQALDCWLDLPELTLHVWINTLNEVEHPPADPALTPAATEKNAVSQE